MVLLVSIAVQVLERVLSPWIQLPYADQALYVLVPMVTLEVQQSLYSISFPDPGPTVVTQLEFIVVAVAVQGSSLPICPVFKLHVPQGPGVP
jgi:hypothetical protein